jgi:hypothetical protein
MKLNELCENEDNPRKLSEDDLNKLVEKLRRNEGGLKAMRIAYYKDGGRNVVISGNTRLKALRKMYGDDWEVPDDYLQDLSCLSEAERHEFIVNANHSDGKWDLDRLLEQYTTDDFKEWGMEDVLKLCPTTSFDDIPEEGFDVEMPEHELKKDKKEKQPKTTTCPYCGKETKI